MVQHDINEQVRLAIWNTTGTRLTSIFTDIFRVPVQEPITINIYEPLADPDAVVFNQIKFDNSRRNIFILFSGEGHSEREYNIVLDRFKTDSDFAIVDEKDIIIHTSALALLTDKYHHITNLSGIIGVTLKLSGSRIEFNPVDKHYVCLNRENRWHRQWLVEEIHRRNLQKFGLVSYLNIPEKTTMPELYPLVVDMPSVTHDQGYELNDPIRKAAINIITETSFENDLGQISAPGVTEKTFKSILLCQFPLFVSSYKTVYHYRMLGFDVFDDVIDHSYDLIEDPQERLECIMDTLRKICGRPWAYYHHLREDMLDRFYDNYKMMERYIDLSFETKAWHDKFQEMKVL